MNVLDQIMGVQEAAELWGLSADRVKGLCQNGQVAAKKIGKTWVLLKEQPNPKGVRRMTTFAQVGVKHGAELHFEGKVLHLTHEARIDEQHYGDWRDQEHRYVAVAVDAEDNEYRVYWDVLDQDGFAELQDTSDACDWDTPSKVVLL